MSKFAVQVLAILTVLFTANANAGIVQMNCHGQTLNKDYTVFINNENVITEDVMYYYVSIEKDIKVYTLPNQSKFFGYNDTKRFFAFGNSSGGLMDQGFCIVRK